MYYIFVKNNEIDGKGQCKCLNDDVLNFEVSEDIFDNSEKYIFKDGQLILDPDFEEKEKQKERERIGNLTCTKRVFALMLQELGITYTQLKELIATNEQAQLEWDLCIELERKNPLLDIMASQLGVTSEQLDNLFKYANGEITKDEFIIEDKEEVTEQVNEQVNE